MVDPKACVIELPKRKKDPATGEWRRASTPGPPPSRRTAMAASGGSVWFCDTVCQITVRVRGTPKRLRCPRCRHWMRQIR